MKVVAKKECKKKGASQRDHDFYYVLRLMVAFAELWKQKRAKRVLTFIKY